MIPTNLRKADSFFDFINVNLYEGDGYEVKIGMKYWYWNGETLWERTVTEHLFYRDIEKYVKEGMIYVEK
jgi:hypothetical protein